MESPQQVPISLDLSDLESQHAMDLDTSPNKTGSHGAEAAETEAAALLRAPLLDGDDDNNNSESVSNSLARPKSSPPLRRTFRPRKDIQLKPFTLENLKYTALVRRSKYDELLNTQQPQVHDEARGTHSRERDVNLVQRQQQKRAKESSSKKAQKRQRRTAEAAVPITSRIWPSGATTKRVSRVYGRRNKRQKRSARALPVRRRASIRAAAKPFAKNAMQTETVDTQQLMKESFKQLFPDLFSEGEDEDNEGQEALDESDPEESPIVHHRLQKRKWAQLNSDDEGSDDNADSGGNFDIFDFPSSPAQSLNMSSASSNYISIHDDDNNDNDEFEIPPLIPPHMQPKRRRRNAVKELRRRDGQPKRVRKPRPANEFENFIVEDENDSKRQTAQGNRKRPRTLKGVLPFSFAKVAKENENATSQRSKRHAVQKRQTGEDVARQRSSPPSSPRRPLSNVDLNIFDSPQHPSMTKLSPIHRQESMDVSPKQVSSASKNLQLSLNRFKNVRQTKLLAPEHEYQHSHSRRAAAETTMPRRRGRSDRIESYFARAAAAAAAAAASTKPTAPTTRKPIHVHRASTVRQRPKRRRVAAAVNPVFIAPRRVFPLQYQWQTKAPVDPQFRLQRVQEYLEDQVNNMPIVINDDDENAIEHDDEDTEYEDIIEDEESNIDHQDNPTSIPTSAEPATYDYKRDLRTIEPKDLFPGSVLPDTIYIQKGFLAHLVNGKPVKLPSLTFATVFGRNVDLTDAGSHVSKKFKPLFMLAFKHLANLFDELGPVPEDATMLAFYDFVSWSLHTWLPTLRGRELRLARAFFAKEIECLCERMLVMSNFKDRPPTDNKSRTKLLITLLLYTMDWSYCLDRAPGGSMEMNSWCRKELCAKRLLWILFWMGPDQADIDQKIVHIHAENALVVEAWVCLIQLYGNVDGKDINDKCDHLLETPLWAFLGDLIIHEYGKTWEAVRIAKQWARQIKTLLLFDSEGMVFAL